MPYTLHIVYNIKALILNCSLGLDIKLYYHAVLPELSPLGKSLQTQPYPIEVFLKMQMTIQGRRHEFERGGGRGVNAVKILKFYKDGGA